MVRAESPASLEATESRGHQPAALPVRGPGSDTHRDQEACDDVEHDPSPRFSLEQPWCEEASKDSSLGTIALKDALAPSYEAAGTGHG